MLEALCSDHNIKGMASFKFAVPYVNMRTAYLDVQAMFKLEILRSQLFAWQEKKGLALACLMLAVARFFGYMNKKKLVPLNH